MINPTTLSKETAPLSQIPFESTERSVEARAQQTATKTLEQARCLLGSCTFGISITAGCCFLASCLTPGGQGSSLGLFVTAFASYATSVNLLLWDPTTRSTPPFVPASMN